MAELVELGPLRFIGTTLHCANGDTSAIGPLWDALFQRHDEVPQSLGYWGVSWGDDAGGFYYMAAHQVPAGTPPLDGMDAREVAAARYVRRAFQDAIDKMPQAFGEIYERELPAAGLTMLPEGSCLEFYPPDCWDEAAGTIKAELYVSVVPQEAQAG